MNCDNIKNLSLAYFNNEIDKQQQQIIENHLQSCESCSQFYLFSKSNLLEIEKIKRTENDPFLYHSIMAKMENQDAQIQTPSYNPSLRLALVSLLLLMSTFGGLFLGNYSAEILNSDTINISEVNEEEQFVLDLANNEVDIFNDFNNSNYE